MPLAPRVDPPFKPKEPLMGGLEQVSSKEFVAYTGGKPNSTWTGLDSLASRSRHNSRQFRYISGASFITAEDPRRQGLSTKFSKGSDFVAFTCKVKKKLETFGMDSIAYVPSTVTKGQMVNIVDSHAIFESIDILVIQIKIQRKCYTTTTMIGLMTMMPVISSSFESWGTTQSTLLGIWMSSRKSSRR
jgi:hypothetical protein